MTSKHLPALLYPRIPPSIGAKLAAELAGLPLEDLVARSAAMYESAIYATTGGNRVGKTHLLTVQEQVRALAHSCGYPQQTGDEARRRFDADSGRLLYDIMGITPTEASIPGVWTFMGCVLLPDVVRWRFPGSERTTDERFLGRARGIRNTFGRVWWRAHVLRLPGESRTYSLLEQLGEDELVQIMERPNLAASPDLAKQVALSFLGVQPRYSGATRSDVLRDAMKRLRRLFSFVSFDALDAPELKMMLDEVFEQSCAALVGGQRQVSRITEPASSAESIDTTVDNSHSSQGVNPDTEDTSGNNQRLQVVIKSSSAETEGRASTTSNDPLGLDPLPTALVRHIPANAWMCSTCGSQRRLWITRTGPRIQCTSKTCGLFEPVAAEIIATALQELGIQCHTCGATVRGGEASEPVRCSNYPDCDGFWLWQPLRNALRHPAPQ